MTGGRVASAAVAVILCATAVTGGWKVREVRAENARLARLARECRLEKEAFLAMLSAAAEGGRRQAAVEAGGDGR